MPVMKIQAPDLGQAPVASDVILAHLRKAIADGTLDEGEPIRQDDVAALFNVSKIPVREALKRLEAEGLVEFRRNKGAIVTKLSEPEIAQIFELRAILEAAAIKRSVPNMNEETYQKASSYCEAFEHETDVARWSELNWHFHKTLYEDAARPYLIDAIRTTYDRLERYLRVQLTLSHGKRTADNEHRQILAAVRARDVSLAETLTYDHIMDARRSLLDNLPTIKKTDETKLK
ncbi:GntR family transcriptional regulator [Bartonella sp. LJL80]